MLRDRLLVVGAALFLVFSILVFAGATASAAEARAGATTASPDIVLRGVHIVSFAFQPAIVVVPVGGIVVWQNSATIDHTTTSDTGQWDSGAMAPGALFHVIFTKVGVYRYHCSIHPFMKGAIIAL